MSPISPPPIHRPLLLTQPIPPVAVKGVTALFIGWVTSPLLAMLAAGILFFLVR